MKKTMSLILALALCLALSVPALAVESTTAGLTPDATAAYLDVLEFLYRGFGAPTLTDLTWESAPAYYGMCGGYIADLGDGGCPELIIAYAKENYFLSILDPISYIRVYSWNGYFAAEVYEEEIRASGNGRAWPTYTLHQNGNTAWLECMWQWLPLYGGAYPEPTYVEPESTYFHMENGKMTEFTPDSNAVSAAMLGTYDYITFNNYDDLVALLKSTVPANSAGPTVTVGGKAVEWTDAEPFIDENSRTMVPLRAVADAMGLTVSWDAADRVASFTDGSKTIYFPIGSSLAPTGDGGSIEMNTAAVIVNGRTYAPVRYLAEYFGYTVGWDAAARTVTIN